MPPDYYKILGINHVADLQEIKQATLTRANEIKTAFAVLSQADTRTAYDAKLDQGPHNHYATLAVSREANLAQIKAAAQARITEIKEAYENLSKPETRATYDSQWQPAKPTSSVTPPKPPRLENLFPPATRAAADSHWPPVKPPTPVAPEIELATRGTRLKAVIYDVLIIGVLLVLKSIFATDHLIEQFVPTASFLVPVIGVILTNLVLLYRHGQTLGKHICSVKMVNADGSRAGLGILLVRTVVAVGIPLLAAILLIKGLAPPIIGTLMAIALLIDSLFILQNSRRCLHDRIAKTIVVKVFPGEAAAPVLIGRQKDVAYNVTYKFMEIIAKVGLSFVPFGSLMFKRDEQRSTNIEIPPVTRVRQGPPASKGILLLLTLFLGWMGAHHFYLGRYARGTLYLLFFWTWLPGLFALMEFLMFLFTSSSSIKNDYTADNSVVAFLFIPVPVVFLGFLVIAQWTAYTDDLKRGIERGKVSEVVELLNGLKTPAEQYMATKGQFPSAIEEMTKKTSDHDIAILASNPEEFYFEATMNQQDSVLAGKVVWLIFHRDSKTWYCRTSSPNNGIPPEYLPTGCNSSTVEVIANSDYWKREKVSKAIQLLEELKKPAEQYLAVTGEFPPTITLLTNRTSGKYTANLVSNPEHFYLEATMSKEDTVLSGKSVWIIYHPDSKTWDCSAAYPNGIPQQYLPSVCQSSPAEITANLNSWRRAEVSEAIQLLEELKTPTEQYLATKGEFPPTIDVVTKKTAGKYTANLISNPQQFYFEATMNKKDSVMAGKVVRLNYYLNTKLWSCSAAYPKGIPQQYLPKVCQSSDAEIIAIINPAMRDKLSRSKVSEAIWLLEGVMKPAMEEYIAEEDQFPPALELLALLPDTNKASIKYTASIIPNPEEFYLEATLKKEGSVLAGNVVRLIYHPKSKTWSCSAAYPNGIPQQYLPDVCKLPAAIIAAATSVDDDNLKIEKVLDAIQLLGKLIKPAEQYLATKGEFPLTIEVLTKKTTSKYTTNLLSNPQQSYFEATMNQEDKVLAGKTVRLIYHPDTKTWRYSAAYPNGIPLKYLPGVYQSPFTIVPKAPAPVTPSHQVAPPLPKVPEAPPVKPGINILKCLLRRGRC